MPLWQELLRALALVLVIEALLPFISPRRYRRTILGMAGMDDRQLRIAAGVALLVGFLILQLLRD